MLLSGGDGGILSFKSGIFPVDRGSLTHLNEDLLEHNL